MWKMYAPNGFDHSILVMNKDDMSQQGTYNVIRVITMWLGCLVNLVLYRSLTMFSVFFASEFNVSFKRYTIIAESTDVGIIIGILCAPYLREVKINSLMGAMQLLIVISTFLSVIHFGDNFASLIILRFWFGISLSVIYCHAQKVTQYFLDGKNFNNALNGLSWASGSLGFLLVGIILAELGYKPVFWVLSAIQSPYIFFLWFSMPSESVHDQESEIVDENDHNLIPEVSIWTIFSSNSFLTLTVCALLVGFSSSFFFMNLSVWFNQLYGYTATGVAFVAMAICIGEIMMSVVSFTVLDATICTVLGSVMMMVSIASVVVIDHYRTLDEFLAVLLIFVFAIGLQMIYLHIYEFGSKIIPSSYFLTAMQRFLTFFLTLGMIVGGISAPYVWIQGQIYSVSLTLAIISGFNCIFFYALSYCENEYQLTASNELGI